jgi:hypothetical protein
VRDDDRAQRSPLPAMKTQYLQTNSIRQEGSEEKRFSSEVLLSKCLGLCMGSTCVKQPQILIRKCSSGKAASNYD